MTHTRALHRLESLLNAAPVVHCNGGDRIVIFSDLHLGDGSTRDESVQNADLLSRALTTHYLKNNFQLVLNGDIEDLYKFSLAAVLRRQESLFNLFSEFQKKTALYKIVGNHDLGLLHTAGGVNRFPLHPALRLKFKQHEMFIHHGHLADILTPRFNGFFSLLSRHVISPLGIRNGSVADDEMKKYRTEKRIYDFAKAHKMISIIGHTHRPLFESLSRIDYLKFQIESLCRIYPDAESEKRAALAAKARAYQKELQDTLEKDSRNGSRSSLYDSGRLVPCLFNSGCATGKRGITALEIMDGKITLAFWFDRARTMKYFNFNGYQPEQLQDTSFFRVPLKQDNLDYIFARIELLA